MSPTEDSKLDQLVQSVTRIETKLFGAAEGDEGFVQSTNSRLKDHSKRIGSLEKWRYGVTIAVAVLLWLVGHHLISVPAESNDVSVYHTQRQDLPK